FIFFFFQAEDGIRDDLVTGVQTCALPIYKIHSTPATDFDTTVAGLKILKTAKVSDSVIRAMINPHRQRHSYPPQVGTRLLTPIRSEERRVGKECKTRGEQGQ